MIARPNKAKLLVLSTFFVGVATGVLVGNFYTTHLTGSPDAVNASDRDQRTQRAQRDINRFYDYLGLDQAQR